MLLLCSSSRAICFSFVGDNRATHLLTWRYWQQKPVSHSLTSVCLYTTTIRYVQLSDTLINKLLSLPCQLYHFSFGHNQVGTVYQFKDISDLGNGIGFYQSKGSGDKRKMFKDVTVWHHSPQINQIYIRETLNKNMEMEIMFMAGAWGSVVHKAKHPACFIAHHYESRDKSLLNSQEGPVEIYKYRQHSFFF